PEKSVGLPIRIDQPVFEDAEALVVLALGFAVQSSRTRGDDLYDQFRRPSHRLILAWQSLVSHKDDIRRINQAMRGRRIQDDVDLRKNLAMRINPQVVLQLRD